MDKLDFKHFDEKFNNVPQKVGEELSDMDLKRDAWIAENALNYKLEPAVPENIEGSQLFNQASLDSTVESSQPPESSGRESPRLRETASSTCTPTA